MLDSNTIDAICNCVKNPANCPPGECCTEPCENPVYGMVCKHGTCNRRTGHCKFRNNSLGSTSENFSVRSHEGYLSEDKPCCSRWEKAFYILLVISALLGACVLAGKLGR